VTNEEAIQEIERIIAEYPELTDHGFGTYKDRRLSPEQRQENFRIDRALMFHPDSIDGFSKARAWLRQWPKTKHPNTSGTSYGLKHVAEHDIGYVTNGMFIAAAIAEGFTIKRDGPNARLNITKDAGKPKRPHDPFVKSDKPTRVSPSRGTNVRA
jgi:hypothetical protein